MGTAEGMSMILTIYDLLEQLTPQYEDLEGEENQLLFVKEN